MEVYFLISFLLVFFLFISLVKEVELRWLCACFTIVIFVTISALRWERGTDWNTYLEIFEGDFDLFALNGIEPGYLLLMKIVKEFDLSYTTFLLFSSLVVFIPLFKLINEYSVNKQFSLFALWCLSIGTIFFVRQTLAISISVVAVTYLLKNNTRKFLLSIAIASAFHFSSLIMLVALFFIKKINYKYMVLAFFVVFTFLYFLLGDNSFYIDKFTIYTNANYIADLKSSGTTASFALSFMNRLAIIVLVFFAIPKPSSEIKLFRNFLVVGLILHVISEYTSPIVGRFVLFFDIYQIILIPAIIYGFKDGRVRNLFFLFFIFYLLLRYYRAITGEYIDLYIPYKSIFDKSMPVIVY